MITAFRDVTGVNVSEEPIAFIFRVKKREQRGKVYTDAYLQKSICNDN
jgi:hypothetical protein